MTHRFIIALLLLLASISASAEISLQINLSRDQPYLAWADYQDGKGAIVQTAPIVFKGKLAEIRLPDSVSKSAHLTVNVLDRTTGNLASVPVTDPSQPIRLARFDFDHIRTVRLRITSGGKPVSAAKVTVTIGGKESQPRILDPTMGGVVDLKNVPGGRGIVRVTYGDNHATTQDIELPLDRDTPVLTAEVAVAGAPVLTSGEMSLAEGKKPSPSERRASAGEVRGRGLLNSLIALVFAALLLGIVLIVLREKGVLGQLKNSVADVGPADETAAPQPVTADSSICPFCGQKKDPVSGACACSLTATAPVSGLPSGGLRLVGVGGGALGQVIPLAGGVTIGRDPGNTIALTADTTVSRRHASIQPDGAGFVIQDTGSSNGTFVNGIRIQTQVLSAGDEVRIGGSLFRVEG